MRKVKKVELEQVQEMYKEDNNDIIDNNLQNNG